MKPKIGIVMDPIESIKTYKDSSFAMLLAAQRLGWTIYYMNQSDLFQVRDQAFAHMRVCRVEDNPAQWYELEPAETLPLTHLDVILMRKDPPFNMEYIYTTYMLEAAEKRGVLVVNRPASLRNANEKLFATQFPECIAETLVSRQPGQLREFVQQQQDAILKPLDGMGGQSIFRVSPTDANLSVILETITELGQRTVMAQKYIPEITQGDKRILMIDGEPVPYALARIPAEGETRGNLAAGGEGVGMPLTEREQWICDQVGPSLKAMGLLFVGLDVIGDYLTEINVTSPTCIRELDQQFGLDIAGQLMHAIEQQLS